MPCPRKHCDLVIWLKRLRNSFFPEGIQFYVLISKIIFFLVKICAQETNQGPMI